MFCLNLLDKKTILAKDNDFFKAIDKISIPQFPFDGKFLIKRKVFKKEKKLEQFLKEAEKLWARNNFNLSLEDFEVIIKKNTLSN